MLPFVFYKTIHLIGLFVVAMTLGAIASHRLQGGTKQNFKGRKLIMALHGTGLLLALVAGFGLLARGGHSMMQGWVLLKLVIWLVAGMYPMFIYKQKAESKLPLILLIGLIALAVLAVEYKFI